MHDQKLETYMLPSYYVMFLMLSMVDYYKML